LPVLGLVTAARRELLVDLVERGGGAGLVVPAAAQLRDLLQRPRARRDADLLFEAADELPGDDTVRRPDEHGRDGYVSGACGSCGGERRRPATGAGGVGEEQP